MFVDAVSGKINSQPVVAPGDLFVSQFLTYFDQYARSHQLWAPDSSSFLLPIANGAGSTVVELLPRNGGPGRAIDGAIGFWSP